MRVFLTKWMTRFARREGLSHASLINAVKRAERGLIDADLGGGLIKQRVARQGKGRSGGYRTLIVYRRSDRAVFVFGFAKSDRENISGDQLDSTRELARTVLSFGQDELDSACDEGEMEEIDYGNEEDE